MTFQIPHIVNRCPYVQRITMCRVRHRIPILCQKVEIGIDHLQIGPDGKPAHVEIVIEAEIGFDALHDNVERVVEIADLLPTCQPVRFKVREYGVPPAVNGHSHEPIGQCIPCDGCWLCPVGAGHRQLFHRNIHVFIFPLKLSPAYQSNILRFAGIHVHQRIIHRLNILKNNLRAGPARSTPHPR